MSGLNPDDVLLPLRSKEFKIKVYLLGILDGYSLSPNAKIMPTGYVRCSKDGEDTVVLFSEIQQLNPELFETKQTSLLSDVVKTTFPSFTKTTSDTNSNVTKQTQAKPVVTSSSVPNTKGPFPTGNEPIRISETVDISGLNLDKISRISSQADIEKIRCEESLSPAYNNVKKMIAIGDIHGDLQSLLTILLSAKLINNQLEWTGQDTNLIFTGDLLDNYRSKKQMAQHPADEITIISFLSDLNFQAEQQHGRVLLCLGNHELMNIINKNYKYVSESTIKYFDDVLGGREAQFTPGSHLLQKISCLFETFVLINNKYFFCHAGLTPHFIDKINAIYPKYLSSLKSKLIHFNDDVKNIIKGTPKGSHDLEWFETNFNSGMGEQYQTDSFFWTRNYDVNVGSKSSCNEFNAISTQLGLQELIMIKGHDTLVSMDAVCDNRIFRIDTGISRSTQTDVGDLSATDDNLLQSKNMSYLIIDLIDQENPINIIVKIDSVDNETIRQKLIKFNQYPPQQPSPPVPTPSVVVQETVTSPPRAVTEEPTLSDEDLSELYEELQQAHLKPKPVNKLSPRRIKKQSPTYTNSVTPRSPKRTRDIDSDEMMTREPKHSQLTPTNQMPRTMALWPTFLGSSQSLIEMDQQQLAHYVTTQANIVSETKLREALEEAGIISLEYSNWTDTYLNARLGAINYYQEHLDEKQAVIDVLLKMKAQAGEITNSTPMLTPDVIRATPSIDLARMAVARAAESIQSDACIGAISSKISGTNYKSSWTREQLTIELSQEQYFIANHHHLEPIIRALVDMRAEAESFTSPTKLSPEFIRKTLPIDLARMAAARAAAALQSEACVQALSSKISGSNISIDWTRDDLMEELPQEPCFIANPHHVEPIVDALVGMREEAELATTFAPTRLTPEAIKQMSPKDIAIIATIRARENDDVIIEAVAALGLNGTTYTSWQRKTLLPMFLKSDYFNTQSDLVLSNKIIDALVGMREEAEQTSTSTLPILIPWAVIFQMQPYHVALLATQRAGIVGDDTAECIKAVTELGIMGRDHRRDWHRPNLLQWFSTSPYFNDHPDQRDKIIDALVQLRKDALTLYLTRLTPEILMAASSQDLAQEAAARAGIQPPEDCVSAIVDHVNGRTYRTEWRAKDLMIKLKNLPYFVANRQHLIPIIRALVDMKAEAELATTSAHTKLTPEAIKKMSSKDIAIIATKRAGIEDEDCVQAVSELNFSGRTYKKDWQRKTPLLNTFLDSAYFKTHTDHSDKIIDALVAMREEAMLAATSAPTRMTYHSLSLMTPEQVAQEAAVRAGIQSSEDCVLALIDHVNGKTSQLWTTKYLTNVLEKVPYFVANPQHLKPIVDALLGMKREVDLARFGFPSTQNAEMFKMEKPELDNATPEEQEQILGTKLYTQIYPTHPNLAGRITYMFLEAFDTQEILNIIDSPKLLDEKIRLALDSIKRLGQAGDAFKLEEFKP
jgi:hypothetical protein